MKHLLLAASLLFAVHVFCQQKNNLYLKTNLLSLVAQRPTITLEKSVTNKFSVEVSYVQGSFNNFLFTNEYNYNGILIKGKIYFEPIASGKVIGYGGVYLGNLKRKIESEGYVDNTGWINLPYKNLTANSIRGGGSLGVVCFSRSRFLLDVCSSLGYGKYTKILEGSSKGKNGYLDAQLWFSIGLRF